ncbi:MAG: tetratricopeptide repeat protein [Nitrospinaceae bacterium]|nr:tetratricopeptide repeat protein [Nitrospinaceae bacterium]NIX37232.1 tetratricopeptide repeat protein [Nitrospinaceae bacterium]NIY18406.1 tetratricopeptide repeat protein [Nitrospinaceae bacterium]
MNLSASRLLLFFFIPALTFLPSRIWAETFNTQAREGITHYQQEEYKQAVSKFQESQDNQPDNPQVTYNLANSQFRLGRYEAAVESYQKVLSENASPELKQKSFYNMGNAYYRIGYLDKAIESYQKALELNPADMDSKFNLEYARQQHEQNLKANRVGPRDQNLQGKDKTHPQAPNPPASPEKKPESEDPSGEQSPESPDGENETAQKDSTSKPQTAPGFVTREPEKEEDESVRHALEEMTRMSPEEAERWLGSLSEDLKKITRRQMQGRMKDMFVDHDKDW